MTKRQERMNRIVGVYDEFLAVEAAMALFRARLRIDPVYPVAHEIRIRVVRNAETNLEGTYLIRLFAEFEAGLRDFWQNALGRPSVPLTKDLIGAVGIRSRIPDDRISSAHEVRDFRNGLVHLVRTSSKVSIASSKKHLCSYFKFLPVDW